MPMTHIPEISAENRYQKPVPVSGASGRNKWQATCTVVCCLLLGQGKNETKKYLEVNDKPPGLRLCRRPVHWSWSQMSNEQGASSSNHVCQHLQFCTRLQCHHDFHTISRSPALPRTTERKTATELCYQQTTIQLDWIMSSTWTY